MTMTPMAVTSLPIAVLTLYGRGCLFATAFGGPSTLHR
eukprot:CAMPEP_0172544512 /NCGR_PEP_ID=MMETSP1067-20121228/14656_1 /TAXON_ID=265564 ORGANISM="Thalassiosira punctigera, Strain Tpunct2005C2" /NCGR_SAMPLE_ID=MMETSP1067 /ASSEMBLY_ACC=CAM_ASM_000444 /LENGTH=37 /DNA_ID= /DNA_START= /DNA_END= /DNA_ORIENTATION=